MSHVFPPPLEGHYAIVDGRIRTRSLEAHVVDHCNLTCARCCSLSPLLPERFTSPDELARDLARARRALAPSVFKLVGGEPLLHPRLIELLTVAREAAIAPTLSVTTNGLRLLRMGDEFWKAVDAITISVYPSPRLPGEQIDEIETRAEQAGVKLNWKYQDQFVDMDRAEPPEDPEETRAVYAGCWLRERCHMVHDGLFYTCTRPPHMARLHRNDPAIDGVLLHDGPTLASEILTHLRREQPLEACSLCRGGSARMFPHVLLSRSEVRSMRGR